MILADKSLVLRYVVPFSFQVSYDALFQHISTTALWKRSSQPTKKAVIFSHLYQAVYGDNSNSMGSAWEYVHTNNLPQLLYDSKLEDFPTQWRIRHAQIHIFRTGIGLLWYEIEPLKYQSGLNLDELIRMQNRFKDCSYTKELFGVKHRRRSKEEADTFEPFDASVWLGDLLRPLGDFCYMSGSCLKDGKVCPDRALIFNYVLLQQSDATSDQTLQKIAFWMANGYTQNYLPSANALSAGISPFEDVRLYASRSGCGYYAVVNDGNRAFFSGNFNDSIRKDYFFLYLLVLYQSFSLMHFSEKCAMEFPSDPALYNESTQIGEQLDSLVLELNTFLMKGMHSSVSSIQHHNDFYNYLTARLMIHEDTESIKIGTDALVEIQHMRREQKDNQLREAAAEEENRRDRRQNIALAILSLFSLFAVFQDLDAFFWTVVSLDLGSLWQQICSGSWLLLIEILIYCFALTVATYCISVLASSFLSEYRKRHRKGKK